MPRRKPTTDAPIRVRTAKSSDWETIVRLFGDRRPPVRALRNLGMLAFDMVPGIRKTFAKHTMGLAGRLPRLSRGLPLE